MAPSGQEAVYPLRQKPTTLVASGAIPEATSGDDAVAEVGDIMGEIAVVARRVLEQLPATARLSPGPG